MANWNSVQLKSVGEVITQKDLNELKKEKFIKSVENLGEDETGNYIVYAIKYVSTELGTDNSKIRSICKMVKID